MNPCRMRALRFKRSAARHSPVCSTAFRCLTLLRGLMDERTRPPGSIAQTALEAGARSCAALTEAEIRTQVVDDKWSPTSGPPSPLPARSSVVRAGRTRP